jgi:hypothetical protein
MTKAGASKRKRFEKLGALYQTRNIDLIDSQMPSVAKSIGDRLIIWDLSGASFYLKTWAKAAGAHYLPMRVATKENPVEQLQKAMTALQQHSSAIVKETLPEDHERRAAIALTTIPEIAAKVQPTEESTPKPPSPPVEIKAPEPAPLTQQPVASPPIEKGKQFPSWVIALLLLGGTVGIYFFCVIDRKAISLSLQTQPPAISMPKYKAPLMMQRNCGENCSLVKVARLISNGAFPCGLQYLQER